MIAVRVPADAKPVLASEKRFTVTADDPLALVNCPACGLPLRGTVPTAEPPACVLVLAGIEPAYRKPSGWTTGGAVAVHEACAVAS